MELITWLIASYGMSQILVYGTIFNGLRNSIHSWGENKLNPFNFMGKFLSELISCMMCTSTWVGFFISWLIYSPFNQIMGVNPYLSIFFDGMLASGGVWALNAMVEWFEENRK